MKLGIFLIAATVAAGLTACNDDNASTPNPMPTPSAQPDTSMSFFVTSITNTTGNLGGLSGADSRCQSLAAAAGAGAKTWRAYLSVQAEGNTKAINARDRIGKGPWVNAAGVPIAANLEELHDPAKNKINEQTGLAETGKKVSGRQFVVNQHDILTGTQADGTAPPAGKDMTCGNWTLSGEGTAIVGHHDREGASDTPQAKSWNSSHNSRGCSHPLLRASGGAGMIYCFAAN